MTTDEMRSWLADIDHALRNGSRMTRANLSFERLCGALGVNPNALRPVPREDLPADLRTKALAGTATRLGYELGRKEALKEIADGMGFESHFRDYVTVQLDLDTFGKLLAAREIATKDPK